MGVPKALYAEWGDMSSISQLIEPDILLPQPNRPALSPEKRLLLGILDRAVDDLRLSRAKGQRHIFRSAVQWFEGYPAPITFSAVCACFHFDQDCIRAALKKRVGSLWGKMV